MAKPAIPSAGCATLVSVNASRCLSRASSLKAEAGNMRSAQGAPDRSHRCRLGKATNRSASIPGRWLPWPG